MREMLQEQSARSASPTRRLVRICQFFVRPKTRALGHWPSDYIPHYRDMAILPDGRPRVRFLKDVMGLRVSAEERDDAWVEAMRLGYKYPFSEDFDVIFGYYFDDRAS